MIGNHCSYQQLVSDSDPLFDAFYAIYVDAITLRERKPRSEIAAIAGRDDYSILLLKSAHAVIGFSIVYSPFNEQFCLLEYMAVHAGYRNMGLGRELFLHTFEHITQRCGPVYGLLEVDSDKEPSADQPMRKRRQQFYRRLGCLCIRDLSYLLLLPGEGEPPQMDLMVFQPSLLPPINRRQLEHWLRVIYNNVYDCPADDPRIAQMMASVEDSVSLV